MPPISKYRSAFHLKGYTLEIIISYILAKFLALQRCLATIQTARFMRKTPILHETYRAFVQHNQSGTPRQPYKGWDLWKTLERFRPKKIIELGSGTTSAVFSLYAQRYHIEYLCYEHSPEWAAVTEKCLRQTRLIDETSPVKVAKMYVAEDESTSGFLESVPEDADFIYVDGPPCPIIKGIKKPNNDVVRLLERGGRPQCIVIDGRIDTVDFIRYHPLARDYFFEPSYVYSFRRGLWGQALKCREHSIIFRA